MAVLGFDVLGFCLGQLKLSLLFARHLLLQHLSYTPNLQGNLRALPRQPHECFGLLKACCFDKVLGLLECLTHSLTFGRAALARSGSLGAKLSRRDFYESTLIAIYGFIGCSDTCGKPVFHFQILVKILEQLLTAPEQICNMCCSSLCTSPGITACVYKLTPLSSPPCLHLSKPRGLVVPHGLHISAQDLLPGSCCHAGSETLLSERSMHSHPGTQGMHPRSLTCEQSSKPLLQTLHLIASEFEKPALVLKFSFECLALQPSTSGTFFTSAAAIGAGFKAISSTRTWRCQCTI
mmetsp:Transcript_132484/g.234294  ORF Transcript_132484/g.234294 Transcript_132484/m.234294 type:complete len:293 (+) Transcript_132484:581-1459(+)